MIFQLGIPFNYSNWLQQIYCVIQFGAKCQNSEYTAVSFQNLDF